MPTYEWICQNCHHSFETQSSIRQLTRPDCPDCSSSEVNRRFSSQIGVIMRAGRTNSVCQREGQCQGRTELCEGHECHHEK